MTVQIRIVPMSGDHVIDLTLIKAREFTAQAYLKQKSLATKRALLARAQRGYAVQRPPLGYVKSETPGMYYKAITADILEYSFKQVLRELMSGSELKVMLSYTFYNNKLITHKQFMRIISNPYYAGFISYNGRLFKGRHEPIITPEKQAALVKLLK